MSGSVPHPFDPLSGEEIRLATSIVRKEHGDAVHFHVITLQEPRKAEMVAWLANPSSGARPRRVAEVVIIDPRDGKGHVYDGLVDLKSQRITKWERAEGQQPIVRPPPGLILERWLTNDFLTAHRRRNARSRTSVSQRPPSHRAMPN